MKKLLQKTTLALAVAAVSTSALAGDLTTNPITLANEVFGSGSDQTLVAYQAVNFDIDTAVSSLDTGDVGTIKLTYDVDAVFGEDLSSIDKWQDAGVVLTLQTNEGTVTIGGVGSSDPANFATDLTNVGILSFTVDQGGAIDDNTVTFQFVADDATVVIEEINVSQVRLKGLDTALARSVNDTVKIGAEFRDVTDSVTDTDVAEDIFLSVDGVTLDVDFVTDYGNTGGTDLRARIDVSNNELNFTGDPGTATSVGDDAASDFDAANNVNFVYLGEIHVVRTIANADEVKKENGDDFDFNGSDLPVITLSSTTNLDSYSSIYLRPNATDDANDCTNATAGGDHVVVPATDALTVDISLQGDSTTQLDDDGYDVCFLSSTTKKIPESTITAALNVTYFNPRYTDSTGSDDLGNILRNGCQVSLFNLPHQAASDDAFLRLTNISENNGAVTASVWDQDGNKVDSDVEISADLGAHATQIFHTNPAIAAGVNLIDLLPGYAAETAGRHRIILQGAFPACEALGLVRASDGTGPLTNRP